MKVTFSLLIAAMLGMALGCNEGTPGGPGAKSNPPASSTNTVTRTTPPEVPGDSVEVNKPVTDPEKEPATPGTDANPALIDQENTFRLDAPNLGVSIKQGETKVVTIGISRSKQFDQDVTLTFDDLPQGIKIEPAEPVIKHGEKEVKLNVTAAGDAALNTFSIKMTGHPATGKVATNEFKLTVGMP